jgi:D-alanyl-D-alanine dipeptidase
MSMQKQVKALRSMPCTQRTIRIAHTSQACAHRQLAKLLDKGVNDDVRQAGRHREKAEHHEGLRGVALPTPSAVEDFDQHAQSAHVVACVTRTHGAGCVRRALQDETARVWSRSRKKEKEGWKKK